MQKDPITLNSLNLLFHPTTYFIHSQLIHSTCYESTHHIACLISPYFTPRLSALARKHKFDIVTRITGMLVYIRNSQAAAIRMLHALNQFLIMSLTLITQAVMALP